MSCVREGGGGITQDHQMRKQLKDVRNSSGEVIDCNGETDNDVPFVTKMREHEQVHRRQGMKLPISPEA